MRFEPLLAVYSLPLLALWVGFTISARMRSEKSRAVLEENREAGLVEPSSLHPVIDPALCLGCGACVTACPEKTILGIIDGKAQLIEPTMCVGHGACQAACPMDAISLVFGTETRGVDIPMLTPEFETSVPGIYIAGELGGMGLIKNAIEQGRQAIEAIGRRVGDIDIAGEALDVLIVGCGPAGISASLGAKEQGLRFETIDQSSLGGTVAKFPRGKLVMTAPAQLPLVGEVRFDEISKEELIGFWEEVIATAQLRPRFEERVERIEREGDGAFKVTTTAAQYRAKTVLLAIGRRGTPRKLEVPGEDLPKVVYRMIDPAQYAGQKVLVVGGGDSALEAAAEIAEQKGSTVTLSYRSKAFSRARKKNRERVASLVDAGRIELLLESQVERITPQSVVINHKGEQREIANDAVIICAGGILPTQFLHDTGIKVETKFGTA